MKKLITIVVILIAVGAGGAVFYAKRGEKEPTVTTLTTSRGSIVDAVGATGTLQAVTTVTVGTQVSGIVQSLEGIDFNSIVKKGQVIARLDPSILETQVETAKANLTNANANLKALQLQIATDVSNAALTVQSSLESVQASATARELAQDRLNAMQSKFEVGMSTNYEVVQAQRDYLDAQNAELRALLNYRKALVNFETVQTVCGGGVGAAVAGGGAATGGGGGGL